MKDFLLKLCLNYFRVIFGLLPERLLKYLIVSKMSYLLASFPFKISTLLPRFKYFVLEIKVCFLSLELGDSLAMDFRWLMLGSLDEFIIMLLDLVLRSLFDFLNFYYLSSNSCLMHWLFLFSSLAFLFSSTSSTYS